MRKILLTIAVLLPLALPGAPNASAQQVCGAAINGQDVQQHNSADNPISIDPDQPIELALKVQGRVGTVVLRLESGPLSRTLRPIGDRVAKGGASWTGNADASSAASLGVGLYKATVSTSEGCTLSAWLDVQGSPVGTLAGRVASVVLLAGLGLQVFGLVRGVRHKGGFKWALLGGIPTGLGACVLSQQFGASPITPGWVAGWTTPPVAIGGVLQVVFRSFGASKDAAGATESGATSVNGHEASTPGSRPATSASAPRPPTTGKSMEMGAEITEDISSTPAGSDPPARAPSSSTSGARAQPPEGRASSARPSMRGATRSLPPRADDSVAGPDEVRDPPRSSFALIDCPDVVIAAEPFELVVGLAAAPYHGVTGGELVRPPTSVGDYVLTVQLVADGFTLAAGESWRQSLAVTADAPYPSVRLHLTAQPQDVAVKPGAVQAVYSVNGHTMGLAVRPVAVVRTAEMVQEAPPAVAGQGVEIGLPMDATAADLTVRIQKAVSQSGGRLMWTFDTPHPGLSLPDEPVITDIGDEPESFVRQLITGISVQEGRPGLHAYMSGVGLTIADELPPEFWTLFQEIARKAEGESRQPTIFLLSEEPYVPWELAIVGEPVKPSEPGARFLGAQACVGRWVLGQRRPKLPPPVEVNVDEMAVISGVYDQPGWNRLLDAEAEAAELCRLYAGLPVDAGPVTVLRCLAGDPDADVLHFSLHGVYDPGSTVDGLVLVDGSTLDPFQVKGGVLKSAPFVFLNACQVGAGSKLLGDYAGMAEAFLYAGASGVIAPLWSISDTLARGVARRFYEEAFQGTPPAEVLRGERAHFAQDTPSATALAYLYYGHPSLRLKRPAT